MKLYFFKQLNIIQYFQFCLIQETMICKKIDKFWDSKTSIDIDKQNRRPIFTKQIQKELGQDWMYIDNGKYNIDNWSNIFQKMKKSKAKRLILEKNHRPTLLKQLININFTYLNVLNLKNNKICNIEAMSFINFPNIEWLYLDNNNIVSIYPLVRTKTNSLKKLHFNENYIKEIPAAKLCVGKYFMSFQAEISCLNNITQQDLSFIVKISCLSVRSITFCGKRRIKQQKIYEKIEDRFNYIHLYDSQNQMAYNRPIFF